MKLTASVVICTNGRRQHLQKTLWALDRLYYEHFEVCIVVGPTNDGTMELVERWANPVRYASISVRNISAARNLGLQMACGDVVAFLDDDAIPEPEWLEQIVAGYNDHRVGAVGGMVFNHTGMEFQWAYGTTDRLGRADTSWTRPADEFNFPFSYNFPHLLGANSSFRRQALLDIGGFDEEFEYFLDETDALGRLLDAGWLIRQVPNAFVHHKYAASDIRSANRVVTSWFSIMKNKLYYCFKHRSGRHSFRDIIREYDAFCHQLRNDREWAISQGLLHEDHRATFEAAVVDALEAGIERGLSSERKLMPVPRKPLQDAKVLEWKTGSHVPPVLCVCLLTQDYPPGPVGGTARYVYEIATGMASLGHDVHVITITDGVSHVEFEEGVWVHRLLPGFNPDSSTPFGEFAFPRETIAGPIPEQIWINCATRYAYVRWLETRKRIDCVYSLLWDCEGAAFLRNEGLPVVVGLQTSMAFWLDSNPDRQDDPAFMKQYAAPMIALETALLSQSKAIHAISSTILRDIESRYSVSLTDKSHVIPLGFEDLSTKTAVDAPPPARGVTFRVLFVGRLEARKGIDILLSIAPALLQQFPFVQIDIVGNDTLVASSGQTYRQAFESQQLPSDLSSRVIFHGEVEREQLLGFYRSCDVFVAPSRYESFGIVFVEAMMFSKPVIGCRAGAMPETISDGESGLLANPGDGASLSSALTALILDGSLRTRMGRAGRLRFENHFEQKEMVRSIVRLLREVADKS